MISPAGWKKEEAAPVAKEKSPVEAEKAEEGDNSFLVTSMPDPQIAQAQVEGSLWPKFVAIFIRARMLDYPLRSSPEIFFSKRVSELLLSPSRWPPRTLNSDQLAAVVVCALLRPHVFREGGSDSDAWCHAVCWGVVQGVTKNG